MLASESSSGERITSDSGDAIPFRMGSKAVDTLPTLKKRMEEDGRGNFSYVLPIQGTLAFVPMPIAYFDWEVIVRERAEKET
jgi:hypothetical protein